jgi:hypothetical protein
MPKTGSIEDNETNCLIRGVQERSELSSHDESTEEDQTMILNFNQLACELFFALRNCRFLIVLSFACVDVAKEDVERIEAERNAKSSSTQMFFCVS